MWETFNLSLWMVGLILKKESDQIRSITLQIKTLKSCSKCLNSLKEILSKTIMKITSIMKIDKKRDSFFHAQRKNFKKKLKMMQLRSILAFIIYLQQQRSVTIQKSEFSNNISKTTNCNHWEDISHLCLSQKFLNIFRNQDQKIFWMLWSR